MTMFKNLLIYRFTDTFTIPQEFDDLLGATPFVPCGSQDLARAGWVPAMPDGELPSHTANGCTLVCLRKQQKVLPAAAVADALADAIRKIEQEQGRVVYRKERRELKEEILVSLAPRALPRSTYTYAYIDTLNQLLIVNSSSRNRAEELLTQLRADIGSLPLVPLETETQPVVLLTDWVKTGTPPERFELGTQCELRDVQERGNTVKVREQDLRGDEVLQHIEAGKQVTRLALKWHSAIDFVLGDDLVVRRLRFSDEVIEQVETLDDARAQFDQEFSVMTIEIGRFIRDLTEAFGGVHNDGL